MATTQELADTVDQMRTELARRIGELYDGGHMDGGAAESMEGILEWLGSLEDALRHCDGNPSPRNAYEQAARRQQHAHQAGRVDMDRCELCGLGIRDHVHLPMFEE